MSKKGFRLMILLLSIIFISNGAGFKPLFEEKGLNRYATIGVELGNASIALGDSIAIPIKIYNVSLVDSSGLGSAKISLYYDPAIVNITKIENGENGFDTLTYYDDRIGKISMLGSGTSGVKGNNIEFANITFYGKSNGVII
ncbi:MAG: cohesin domain-containing protein [Methanosarcinales archaeon]